jgi:hypothetical protein
VKVGPAIRCKEIRPEHVDWCQYEIEHLPSTVELRHYGTYDY